MLIIGFFSNSYFAYEEFNSLTANILYLVFISLLFVTALVQDSISDKPLADKIISAFTFGGGLAVFLPFVILGGVFDLIALIYSLIMCIVLLCRCVLLMHKGYKFPPFVKPAICLLFLYIYPALRLTTVNFVSDIFMLWGFIPAAVISAILIPIGFVLLHKVWREFYPKESRSVANAICVCLAVFFVAFGYSFAIIGTINCVFDNSPTPTEYVVLEKDVLSGSRTPTEFRVKVEIDGDEEWIDLPVTDYHALEEGDTVIVDYYEGALGFSFYKYNSIISI